MLARNFVQESPRILYLHYTCKIWDILRESYKHVQDDFSLEHYSDNSTMYLFISGAQAFSSNVYGQNGGRIVLYDVRCNGTEKALVSCPSRSHSNIRCPINRRGVGVRCRPKG